MAAAVETGLPVWLGFSAVRPDGSVRIMDADLSFPVILGRFLTLPEPDYRGCQPADLPY